MTDNSEKALACYLSGLRGVNLAAIDATIADAREGGIAPERIEKAERARSECVQLFNVASGKGTQSAAFQRAMDAGQRLFDIAENLNDLLVLRSEVSRDRARQAGVTKKRRSKMPQLDAWLSAQLSTGTPSNDALWASLPSSDDDEDLYRDGDSVVETNREGRQHAIGRDGFDKRVTAIRKESAANS